MKCYGTWKEYLARIWSQSEGTPHRAMIDKCVTTTDPEGVIRTDPAGIYGEPIADPGVRVANRERYKFDLDCVYNSFKTMSSQKYLQRTCHDQSCLNI